MLVPSVTAITLHHRLHTPPPCLARPLDAAYALDPQVPHTAPTTATAPAAVPLVTCAEVNWLGYVHARRQCPSNLLVGPRDVPVRPLSCFRGQRDTLVPP